MQQSQPRFYRPLVLTLTLLYAAFGLLVMFAVVVLVREEADLVMVARSDTSLLAPSPVSLVTWGLLYIAMGFYGLWQYHPDVQRSTRYAKTWHWAAGVLFTGTSALVAMASDNDQEWRTFWIFLMLVCLIFMRRAFREYPPISGVDRFLTGGTYSFFMGWGIVIFGGNLGGLMAGGDWPFNPGNETDHAVMFIMGMALLWVPLAQWVRAGVPATVGITYGLATVGIGRLTGRYFNESVAIAAFAAIPLVIFGTIFVNRRVRIWEEAKAEQARLQAGGSSEF